jgi:predicted transcriptional regulator
MAVPEERSWPKRVLGELQEEIMEYVWRCGPVSVRDVHRCLLAKRDNAYTTVMTVMSRLAEKGLLFRRPEGRAFIYSSSSASDEYYANDP